MADIYGGMLFENLVREDRYYDCQMEFFQAGLIQGIQLKLSHPSQIKGLSENNLLKILSRLPENMGIFIHAPAEDCGVDLGQQFDERGIFHSQKQVLAWRLWNGQSLAFARKIFENVSGRRFQFHTPWGVIHPGYGLSADDNGSLSDILHTLNEFNGSDFALEIIPPIVKRSLYLATGLQWPSYLKRDNYWGFGGTPDNMQLLIERLNANRPDKNWQCLLDFSHIGVMVNQAKDGFLDDRYTDLERVISAYLSLPHSSVCHFSGIAPTLVDTHGALDKPIPEPVLNALKTMSVICLEIFWQPKNAYVTVKQLEKFRSLLQ